MVKNKHQSMLDQTIKPSGIVIYEDGVLTNELENVIKEYENKYDGMFKVIRNKEK